MFPVSIFVATIAMASGVGGATFFTPILILALRLPPDVAIGVGLITQVFGFASGLWAYGRKQLIDYRLGLRIALIALPAALIGVWAGGLVPMQTLKMLLGVALLGIGLAFLPAFLPAFAPAAPLLSLARGGASRFEPSPRPFAATYRQTILYSGVGGLFLGMVATGLGELLFYFLAERGRLTSKVAVATAVFAVAVVSIPVAAGKFARFFYIGGDSLPLMLSLLIFTVPGALVGAQFGSSVASRIPQRALERSLAVLLLLISALTLVEAFSMGGC
jgi:uncharacterized membrane protein YfcA